MNILNIHGFRGHSHNANSQLLEQFGYTDIISPQLYYEAEPLSAIADKLSSIIVNNKVETIVATSFGAFIGKYLAIKFNLPCLFTNPCLRPDLDLKKINPDYLDRSTMCTIQKWIDIQAKSNFNRDFIIIGNKDNVVDYNCTKEICKGAHIIYVDGGHKLDSFEYYIEFSDCIKKMEGVINEKSHKSN